MAFIQHWLFHEASRHGNLYTLTRAASQLALFSGRLILAHNRMLFPYHKWLPRTLESLSPRMQQNITADDYEVLVVDNASDDGSAEALREALGQRILRPRRAAAAPRRGGEFVSFSALFVDTFTAVPSLPWGDEMRPRRDPRRGPGWSTV